MTTATGSPTWRALPWPAHGCGPAFIGEPSLEWIIQPQIRPAQIVLGNIVAGEHRQYAGRLNAALGVDPLIFGVRVGRADEVGVGLARQVDVVGVAALAGDETQCLPCASRARQFLFQSCTFPSQNYDIC
jgi:hypothetical protein